MSISPTDEKGAGRARSLVNLPVGHMDTHQCAEETSMIWHLQMEEFVHDDEILETRILFIEIDG